MNRILVFILGGVLGLVIGGALILYFVSPHGSSAPVGAVIKPPDAEGAPAGTAVIQLDQKFFAPVLQTILGNGNAPSFPLSLSGQQSEQPASEISCGKITLKPEGSGTVTSVRLENGKILVPIAFSGNFSLGSCFEFSGWAEANLELRFDESQQIVFGQINVQTVNLDGVPPVASGLVTPLVQSTLNNRVNPVQVLRGDQISLKIPVKSTDSTLQARVKDIRAEVKDNSLFFYVTYNFTSERGQ